MIRAVGPLAWVVLIHLYGSPAASTRSVTASTRTLAVDLELSKDTCARGIRVQPEVGLRLRRGRASVELSGPPLLGVVLEPDAPRLRVDVDAARKVSSECVGEAFGIALAVEVFRSLRSSGELAPPRTIGAVGRFSGLAT